MKISSLEEKIGYCFENKALLEQALTHGSSVRESRHGSAQNERLEFLGDAFLDAIIGAQLYLMMPEVPEGVLSKTRANIVCEHSAAEAARSINLGEYLYLGHGEELAGGRNKTSILADAMEAVIGAMYLDGGYEKTKEIVLNLFNENISLGMSGQLFKDYKTQLQEILQAKGNHVSICYVTDKEEGPDHNKTFYIHMECNGQPLGKGIGKTKKEAEQNAAKESIKILERR